MFTKQFRKVESFFWIGIGTIICLFAWNSKLGTFHEPGPGFVPFFTGFFIAGIGMVMAFSNAFSNTSQGDASGLSSIFRNILWRRLTYIMVLLLVYGLALNRLGYILTTFLVMWGLFHDWETKRWGSSFLLSLVTTGVTYLVFEVWLHCQLPRGILPWW